MAAEQMEYVGWQFRYVFEDQGNRRSDWSTVSTGEPSFTSGYRSYNGWQRRFYLEVRRVYAGVVEPYIEDQHHKPGTAGAAPSQAPGVYEARVKALAPELGMPIAMARADMETNAGVDLPDGAKR